MELHFLDLINSCRSFTTSFTPTARSIKFQSEFGNISLIRCLHLSKRSSDPSFNGLPNLKDPNKDLSRILRTDAAVKNIVRKANSKKNNNLWPKAVLEALDEAISSNLWETALKVRSFLSLILFVLN